MILVTKVYEAFCIVVLLTVCVFPSLISGQNSYEVIEIPMRDGKSLVADLYLPNETDTFPVVLIQTPYNKVFFRSRGLPLGIDQELTSSPYAFVVLDWRCRFASLGACSAGSSNGEDGYDAVEWIAAQSWCNGNIGTLGPSALGNIQYQTAREQPPHLVCAIPEVASPQIHYQQYLPGGALRTEYFLSLDVLFPGSGFNLVVANPHYNLLWRITENETMYPEDIKIPMLLIGGWFDHNLTDNLTMIDTLMHASDPSIREKHKILIGPWVHGGTGPSFLGSATQGELNFDDVAGWNNLMSRKFMDYYLLGVDNGWEHHQRYIYYQIGDGSIEESSQWPPAAVLSTTFYLNSDNSITPVMQEFNESRSFIYDPTDPSPTVGGKTLNLALSQGPYDQKEVELRSDRLIYSTETLTSQLKVNGRIELQLYVSSDRKDTDFVLRLTDVFPDGRSMLIGESIQRMRFRNGYTVVDTSFLEQGKVYSLTLAIDDLAYTFLPGHKLRVIITSSNYPRYNRNMNTGEEMYPDNHVDTLVNPLVATNAIWTGPDFPSKIVLPLLSSTPTAVFQSPAFSEFMIYPNPASTKIHILSDHPAGQIWLVDLMGRKYFYGQQSKSKSLDVQSLPDGIYWVIIKNQSGETFSQKLTIIH